MSPWRARFRTGRKGPGTCSTSSARIGDPSIHHGPIAPRRRPGPLPLRDLQSSRGGRERGRSTGRTTPGRSAGLAGPRLGGTGSGPIPEARLPRSGACAKVRRINPGRALSELPGSPANRAAGLSDPRPAHRSTRPSQLHSMFNLTVYCRRTLNTIPPEQGLGPRTAFPIRRPASFGRTRPSSRASTCPELMVRGGSGALQGAQSSDEERGGIA